MKIQNKIIIFLFHVFCSIQYICGQASEGVELDKSIRYGQLDNGLTYYIKPTTQPHPKLQLRLYVKVGSNHHDEDQQGLAHFLEHMAFKASENFPKGIYNDFERLNKINVAQFDFNGHSGTKLTEYTFKAPVNNKPALHTGLLWFEDIANGGLKLKEEDINKERGVYIQEYITRGGDNFQKKLNKSQLNSELFPGAETLDGFFTHIKTFKPQVLKRFYKDWYRPDLMAISVVGNIENLDSLEEEIKHRFSKIVPLDKPRKVKNFDSLFYKQPPKFARIKRHSDSTSTIDTNSIFLLYYRDAEMSKNLHTLNGIKRLIKWSMFIDILNKRFREKTNTYNDQSEIRISHIYKMGNLPPALEVLIKTNKEKEEEALVKAISAIKQIQEHGVEKEEYQEAVKEQVSNLSPDGNKVENPDYWIKEIKNHFKSGEALPENKLGKLEQWLAEYSREDFNKFIERANLEMPEDIGQIVTSKTSAKLISEDQIRSTIKNVYKKTTVPYVSQVAPNSLIRVSEINSLPVRKYSQSDRKPSGITEVILENGVKLILQPFSPSGTGRDKIFIHGFSPVGALSYPKKDYFSAVNAPEFIKNSGVAEFNKFDLKRFLSDKSIFWFGIHPYINNLESGIRINANSEDFVTMLQLIHLFFTDPKATKEGFRDWKFNEERLYENPRGGDMSFIDLSTKIKNELGDQSDVLRGTARFLGMNKTERKRGLEIYSEIFRNSENFTFLVSGDFKINKVLPELNTYLGSLFQNKKATFQPTEILDKPLPKAPYYKEFIYPETYSKKNNKYLSLFIEPIKDENWKERLRVEVLGAILKIKVYELRFVKGYAMYAPSVLGELNFNAGQVKITGRFDITAKELDQLRDEYYTIITELKSETVSEDLLEQSLKRKIQEFDPDGLRNNQVFTQRKLYNHIRFNQPWVNNKEIQNYLKKLTPEDILKTAKKYLKEENSFEFVFKNEEEQ